MSAYFDKNLILQHPLAVVEKGRKASLFMLKPDGKLDMKTYQPITGWSDFKTISGNVNCFTATCLTDQTLCLLEVDKEGTFNLKKRTGNKWNTMSFFQEEKDKQVTHLQLLSDRRGNLHLVYLLLSLNGDQWWLIHHYNSGGKWDEPRVIDFGGEGDLNYGHALIDKSDTLHIVYHLRERTRIPLYHRTFSIKNPGWSRAVFLSVDQKNCYPTLFEGPDYNLHLTWCASHENGYRIRHSKKVRMAWPGGDKWTPATDISPPSGEKLFPFIGFDEDILKIKWVASGCTYQRISHDGGNHWEEIQKKQPANKVQLFRILSPSAWDDLPRVQWITTPDTPDSTPEPAVQKHTEKSETEIMPHLNELQKYSANLFPPSKFHKEASGRSRNAGSPRYHTSSSNAPQAPKTPGKKPGKKEQPAGQTEEKFHKTLETIKQKYQLSRQVWEEENLKLIKENQQLKQEKSSLEQKLDNKDKELKKLQKQAKNNQPPLEK